MKTIRTRLLALGVVALISACGNDEETPVVSQATAADRNTPCDRECLTGFVDSYVEALVANDPSRAPFAPDARFTENAQQLELGDALWNTASGAPGDYQIKVGDPQTGTAGFFLLMEESDRPIWLAGRLKVEEREITELETVVIRDSGAFGNFDLEQPDPEWAAAVPEDQRNTREELFDVADRYFEALEQNLVDYVEFTEDCHRIENGMKTANNPDAGGGDGPNLGAMSCRDNVNSGMWKYITEISPRRYLVADEERGIAMGMFMFHQDGSHATAEIRGYGEIEYSGATRRPFTTVIPEMFKIKDGRIHRIEAVMASLPYRSDSGWDE